LKYFSLSIERLRLGLGLTMLSPTAQYGQPSGF
jgi:hypothetical protein